MNKGEIWLIEFPRVAWGHEQQGFRPALVLAETATTVIVVPFSTNLQTLRFPYVLEVIPSEKNKLKNFSAALVLQLRAIDKRRVKRKIGDLEKGFVKEIDKMLRRLLLL
ncbi:MAG: type II toxin-antitoxin system PemK/MazF family toxin [Nanoarchaeota archaeon]